MSIQVTDEEIMFFQLAVVIYARHLIINRRRAIGLNCNTFNVGNSHNICTFVFQMKAGHCSHIIGHIKLGHETVASLS